MEIIVGILTQSRESFLNRNLWLVTKEDVKDTQEQE